MSAMKQIQTTSILLQNLCVPCWNHCRYCLLSWNGTTLGTQWDRGVSLAERYIRELKAARPDTDVSFSFGYSMEHPDLKNAIQTLRRLGSPTADYLQCDGMAMRDEAGCRALMHELKEAGIQALNFTVYGLAADHDRFAGRSGDYDLLFRMMRAASDAGIPFSTGVPLTKENVRTTDELVRALQEAGNRKIMLFIPHGEGRGRALEPIRLEAGDLSALSPDSLRLLNREIYRTEAEWLQLPNPVPDTRRMILVSFRAENVESCEKRDAVSVVEEIEALDEAYYAAFPSFEALAREYGDRQGTRLYRIRDLFHHYRTLYAAERSLMLYDVTDERQSGSRRY